MPNYSVQRTESVSLERVLHQTIQEKTFGRVRQLQVQQIEKRLIVSGIAQDFYHYQLAIVAASSVLRNEARSIHYDIIVQ